MGEKYKFVYILLLATFLDCIGCSKNSSSNSNTTNNIANNTTVNYYASKYTHLMAGNRVWHHNWTGNLSGYYDTVIYLSDTTFSIQVINDTTILSPLNTRAIHLAYTDYNLLYFTINTIYKNSGWYIDVYYNTLLDKIIMNQVQVNGGSAIVDSFKSY